MPRLGEVVVAGLAATFLITGQLIVSARVAEESEHASTIDAGKIARGRELFQKGLTPAGPLVGYVGADRIELQGELVACARCHGERAKGRPGGEDTPAIHARALSATARRPAYELASFLRAVREGQSPASRSLSWIMPRFELSESQAEELLAYLEVIEEETSPGIEAERILIGAQLPSEPRWASVSEDVRAVLKAAFAELNAEGGVFGRKLELTETQLEQSFALASSILPAGAEAPSTELPSIAPVGNELTDREATTFSLLPTTGDQARWAIQQLSETERIAIVHSRDPFGRAWAEAALEESTRRARRAPARLELGASEADLTQIAEELRKAEITVVMLAAPGTLAARITRALPASVRIVAPGLLAHAALTDARDVRFIYPAQIAGKDGLPPVLTAFLARHQLVPRNVPFQLNAFAAAQVLAEALRRAGPNPTRADLVVALESLQDFETGVTPPLTYGRDRRVGVQGARWVRRDPTSGALSFDSDWVALAP